MKYYVIAKRYDVFTGKVETRIHGIADDIEKAYIFRDAYNEFFKNVLTEETKAFIIAERDFTEELKGKER